MLSAETLLTPDPDVVCSTLKNGETVLLHVGTSQYFSLNETGTLVWQLINTGLNLDEISQQLEMKYEVTREKAKQCVIDLVEELLTEKLVKISKP